MGSQARNRAQSEAYASIQPGSGTAFSLFDMVTIFAYSIAFIIVMLVVESLIVQPLERNASRWRRKTA